MGKDTSQRGSEIEASETIAPAYMVETLYAKGLIQLTPEQRGLLAKGGDIRLPTEVFPTVGAAKRPREAVEWIDAIDAVHLLAPHLGGDANAKAAIAERLRDGAITCTCVWQSFGPDIGRLSMDRPQYPRPGGSRSWMWVTPVHHAPERTFMGGFIWNFSDDWERDVKTWQWSQGLFATRGYHPVIVDTDSKGGPSIDHKRARHTAAGVRFNRRDIEAIRGVETPSALPQPQTKGSPRGPKRSTAWLDWTAELVTWVASAAVDWSQSHKEIHSEIEKRLHKLGKDSLDLDTVTKTISAIKKRIAQAKNDGDI